MPVVCKAWGQGVEKVELLHFSEVDNEVTALSYIKYVDCSSVESAELSIETEMPIEVFLPSLALAIATEFSALQSLDLRNNGWATDMYWLRLFPVSLRHLSVDLTAGSARLCDINNLVNLERFEMHILLDNGSCTIHGDLNLPQLKEFKIVNVSDADDAVTFVGLTLERACHSCVFTSSLSMRSFPMINQATYNCVLSG